MRTFALVVAGLTVCSMACTKSNTTEPDGGGIRFDATLPDADPGDAGPPDAGRDPSGDSDLGGPCTSDADCDTGTCVLDGDGFPDGYCTAPCGFDSDCPAMGVCLPVDRSLSLCFARCDEDAERACRAGYGCGRSFMLPAPICIPGCIEHSDCADGLMCNGSGGELGEGECFDPDSSLGDACVVSEQCPAGADCLTEERAGLPGGACGGSFCDPDADDCIPGTRCTTLASSRFPRCLAECDDDTDCRDGFRCGGPPGAAPDHRVCLGACERDRDCTVPGYECNPATGLCTRPFDPDELGIECSTSFRACRGGTCLSESASGWPGSICVYEGCEPGAEDDGCPGDGVCVRELGRTFCVPGCAEDSDCRNVDYTCRTAFGDPDGPTACYPACQNDGACANEGFECNAGTGLCRPPFSGGDLGDACAGPGGCVGGECLMSADWPEGTCAFPGCRLSGEGPAEDCPSGGACVDDGAGDPTLGVCVTACADGGDACRDGYTCVEGACRGG